LQQGYNQLSDLFGQGRGALTSYGQTGINAPTTAFNQNTQGATQYGNALGLNGAQGNAQAVAGFQNNPGYQFQLDQGNQNILRNQAATGQLNSGGTNLDLLKYGQGLANTGWQNYVNNLSQYLPQQTATAGQVLQGNQNLGGQLNNSFTTQGNAAYGTQVGQGNAQASADLAPLNASANLWGAIGQGAKLGTSLFGTFG